MGRQSCIAVSCRTRFTRSRTGSAYSVSSNESFGQVTFCYNHHTQAAISQTSSSKPPSMYITISTDNDTDIACATSLVHKILQTLPRKSL